MVNSSSEFNDELWTQWRDDLLIRHLDFHSSYDKCRYTAESTHIFESILAFNNTLKRSGITADDIAERFNKLQKMYETWSKIVEDQDVIYNGDSNSVNASDETWNNIYKEDYELGNLYSNDENEHLWPELCGIFGPDSVRIARNALITPYPQSKLTWKSEIVQDSDEEYDESDEEASSTGKERVPKGHICPYLGDRIMMPPGMFRGKSQTSESGVKVKKSKFKRFLDF